MNPTVLRYFGASHLAWYFYDHTGRFVREVAETEVPTERLGPVVNMHGGSVMVMADPRGGWYVARWATTRTAT